MGNGADIICSRFSIQDDQNNWKIVLEQELESTYFSYQTQEPRKH